MLLTGICPARSFRTNAARERNFLLDRPLASKVLFEQKPSVTAPTESPVNPSVLADVESVLAADLTRQQVVPTLSRYSEDMTFEDPLTRTTSRDGYVFHMNALRSVFGMKPVLLNLSVSGPAQITARWSTSIPLWMLPWRPVLTFTGTSEYTVSPAGLIESRTDAWDAVKHNKFVSLEGLQHVLSMATQLQVTPDLEQPEYLVLKKTRDYEIRRYEPLVVAETAMSPGSGVAGGSGFTELAGYIFGGNGSSTSMAMTAPVFTSGGSGGDTPSRMQFVMESRRGGDPAALPEPNSAAVETKTVPGEVYACASFSGWPLESEVVAAEQALRRALRRDGLEAEEAYKLARYNDPATLPFLRRNEVLLTLQL